MCCGGGGGGGGGLVDDQGGCHGVTTKLHVMLTDIRYISCG